MTTRTETPGPLIARGDLHPANVMLSSRGALVIDWANAARGDAALDVALTAVVLAGAPIDPPLSWLRDRFVRAFLGEFRPRNGASASIARWRTGEPMAT